MRLCHDDAVMVVVGEALIDLVIEGDGQVSARLGGAPFNTAAAAARLGADVQFVGALSDDRFGSMLFDRLVANGVGVDMVQRTGLPTTLAAAEVGVGGAATYRFYIDGTSAPSLSGVDLAGRAVTPDVLFTGGLGLVFEPMADTIEALLGAVPESTTVVVDVNCRPNVVRDRTSYLERVDRVLARADVVKVSDDDLEYLLPGRSDAAERLLRHGVAVVVVTRGAAGSLVVTADGEREVAVESLTQPVVDTIGAGDTFGGALLTAWVEGGGSRAGLRSAGATDSVAAAVRAGHAAAAVVVTRPGADPPWRHELPQDWPAC